MEYLREIARWAVSDLRGLFEERKAVKRIRSALAETGFGDVPKSAYDIRLLKLSSGNFELGYSLDGEKGESGSTQLLIVDNNGMTREGRIHRLQQAGVLTEEVTSR